MADLTCDTIVDRVRSICVAAPFSLVEAPSWQTFEETPSQALTIGVFRIPPPSSQRVIGGFGFREDRTDSLQIWIARKHNADHVTTRRTLLREIHSLTSAVVRDGAVSSGDYAVPDEGRGHVITITPGQEYATLRLTLPVNYETQL